MKKQKRKEDTDNGVTVIGEIDSVDEKKIIEETIERFRIIKEKMDQPNRFTEEDARHVFEDVSHEIRSRQISADKDRRMEKIAEEKREQKNVGTSFEKKKEVKKENNNTGNKKKLEYKHKYTFAQKPGHATNKQLSFIQELREQNEERILEIEVDIENVPKLSFDDANKEIRRLKQELGWKEKNKK